MAMPDDAAVEIPQVEMYTDGACVGNPGPGGYGIVLKFGHHRKEISGAFQKTTNNRMELMAAIVGLRALNRRCKVKLTSDSEYLVESVNRGSVGRWRDNGWWRSANQRVANHDLWAQLLDLLAMHEVTLVWTRGHAEDAENERCDWLAGQAIHSAAADVDEGYEHSQADCPQSISEGHPCFKCRTPLVKRTPRARKSRRAHRYEWYLYCPACTAMYMVDEGKRPFGGEVPDPLFAAGEVDEPP
jgi:ribonuclease HI